VIGIPVTMFSHTSICQWKLGVPWLYDNWVRFSGSREI
jgi:hypothetical protein